MTDRSEERRELFWKQLERAERDVQTWPEYVKQALIKPDKAVSISSDKHPTSRERTEAA